MSVELYSDAEAGRLFEELFHYYKKDRIDEGDMLDFFKSKGVEIKGREQLVRLMVKAERAMGWITAKVGEGWIPLIFANTPKDLEGIQEGRGRGKELVQGILFRVGLHGMVYSQ